MQKNLLIAVVALLVGGLGVYFATHNSSTAGFTVTGDQVAKDLLGKSVTLGAGQIWGFTPDQQVAIKVISTKTQDNNVIVAAELKAVVKLEPLPNEKPESKKDEPKIEGSSPAPSAKPTNTEPKQTPQPEPKLDPKQPKQATLDGIVKLYYENINGKWYIVHVEGVQLNVTAE